MKYFLDTEFLEGTQKKLFGKTKPTIDLISIGLVAEDGREYYAISKDFNLKEAWNRYDLEIQYGDMRNRYPEGKKVYWIRENVLRPIWVEECKNGFTLEKSPMTPHGIESLFTYSNFKALLFKYGKTNKQISTEIKNFVYSENRESGSQVILESFIPNIYPEPEFYTYYGAYDWVVFCWLFGKMIDLPKGFPMYSKDLKQMFDDVAPKFFDRRFNGYTAQDKTRHPLAEKFDFVKKLNSYPKIENEHNALADAKWNHELYKFLKKL